MNIPKRQPLMYWCQKVLPLVYDDSLSYYELLNKVVAYLNNTIDDLKKLQSETTKNSQDISELATAFVELRNELTQEIDRMVTEETPIVIGELVSSGQFYNMIVQAIDNLDPRISNCERGISNLNDDVSGLLVDVENLGLEVARVNILAKSYFSGKKIVCYGDSTIHNGNNDTYISILSEIVDCEVTNRGVAGTRMNRMPNNGVSLINEATDLDEFDVITLSYGTNEWQTNETVKQIYTDATAIIEAIRAKNSNIEIVFILPSYAYRNFGNTPANLNNNGLFLYDVNNIISYVMSLYNIPVIDLYHQSTCNDMNYSHMLEDDSGIYVHPTSAFARDLSYIVKSFNTGAKPKYKERDILATYDFYDGQTSFNNTDYNNVGGLSETGLFLHYGGSYTENSTMKTVLSDSIYRICGKTTAPFTLSCGTWIYDIPSGNFDFVVTGLPTGFASFSIVCTEDTVISDFHIMNVYLGGKETPDSTRFGARCVLTKVSDDISSVTGRYTPSVVFTRDSLVFDFAGFQVNSPVSYGDTLYRIPYNFTNSNYLHSYIYAVKSATGDVYALELQGNAIKTLKDLPIGTYIISSNVVINRNISLLN